MARWKVTAKHYIHAEQYGQPTEWERQETNQDTQRMFRKAYKVPMLIDPEDPHCVNRHEGFCVVARKGSEKPGDIVFFGPPTPDMEPMDAESQAETDAEKSKWINPIEGLEPTIGADFGKQLLMMFERQLDAAGRPQAVTLKGATSEEVQSLKDIVAAQQRQIDVLLKGFTKPEPEAVEANDPPVEPDIPLVDIDPNALPTRPPLHVNHPRAAASARR